MIPSWLDQLRSSLDGISAADVSRFLTPPEGQGRESAVLILFSDGDGNGLAEPSILLIERAATLRKHAGQTAFPGGATDPDDADATATALRESREEVGLDADSVTVFGEMPALFLPPSGFLVTPVLGWWSLPHPVAPVDSAEVAGVAVVPIAELVDPDNRFRVRHPSGFFGPGFRAGGLFVWGFTAGLLDYLLGAGGWARDWDRERIEDLPNL